MSIPLGISYGVTKDLELNASIPLVYKRNEVIAPSTVSKESQSGFGDLSLGASYKLKAEQVVKKGVVYVTAAGNSGRNAYQSAYNEYTNIAFGINAHDFDRSESIDIYQRLHVPEGAGFRLVLQWDSPAYSISGGSGAQTDLDIFIFNQDHSKVLASSTFGNIGKDPSEVIFFSNPENSGETKFDLMITKAAGASPQSFKYIILNSFEGIIQEYHSQSGGLFGHANTQAAITVGATDYQETPRFGVTPPLLQYYSSAGGQMIKYDLKGNAINPPITPKKPDIVAPDNVNTTFFGTTDSDKDGYPNISGSSAAAPHAAAVAALLLEVNPKLQPLDIKKILQQTAIDIVQRNTKDKTAIGEGYDMDSGFGLINAEAAVNLAGSYPASKPEKPTDKEKINVNNLEQAGVGAFSLALYVFIFGLCFLPFRRFLKGRRKLFKIINTFTKYKM